MISFFKENLLDLLHLFYPHLCAGCKQEHLPEESVICPLCMLALPETGFIQAANNPVEKLFHGRLSIEAAAAFYFFSKDSILQQLIHALKYEQRQEVGLYLGRIMGHALLKSPLFADSTVLIPLPMHPSKEKQRGYNQATVIAKGIASVTGWSLCEHAVQKTTCTSSQTKKGRLERWENIRDSFSVNNPHPLAHQHVLLIDDVVTTGATLEACGSAILTANPASLRIATLAWSTGE